MNIQNRETLQELFSSFCKKNNPQNMEKAVEYFAVFGGVDVALDMEEPLDKLIEKHILKEYKFLRNDVAKLTDGNEKYHKLLSASALGDRRTNSSFKRASFSFDDGMDLVEELRDMDVISLERCCEDVYVSDKILFHSPFLRFWFAFVSPIFKSIRDRDYKEFYEIYSNRKAEFTQLIFSQLSHELIKHRFSQQKIYNIGRYWDDDREIELVAKTKAGKKIVGVCKYSDKKLNKSDLTKLQESCEKATIKADVYALFAKKGFSNELKTMKSETLLLFTCRNFKVLV